MKIIINKSQILNKIKKATMSSSKIQKKAENVAYKIFLNAKKRMLQNFDNDEVTKEIKEGAGAFNISDTLGGYGDLFSFLGFEAGSDPITPLRDILDEGTTFRKGATKGNKFSFIVKLPTNEQIENVGQMPWEIGNAWPFLIEEGISNLSYFLSKQDTGRSSGGIQIPNMIFENLSFHTRPYLTKIFEEFKEDLEL